ncbi:phosphatase PAP2 family protein [Pararhizobium sp. BT-229]|uniref:phosphatase PAP2 family protein n=1 Tax=Pararhizobium sp. BT-229 TaxID=2986923 RepID=UPI0021F7BF27|nr:phosphatase PAP2 family protein [Pararhizobium sp. BT-229]MCV9965701.1 phosphatase PAP2 family protein [Pararhizobium sp. BT-229]
MILLIVAVAALFTVIDVAWLPFSTVSLDPRNVSQLAKIAGGLLISYLVASFVIYRVGNDPSRSGGFLRRIANSLLIMVGVSALFLPLGFVSAVFMYLASATDAPLIDGKLAALDAAIGFDWLSFLQAANGYPAFASALVIAYHSLTPQIVLLLIAYSAAQRADRLLEFVALLAVSSVFTGSLMALFPTAGAYAYFQPSVEAFDAFTDKAGMWHYSELLQLRSGEHFNLFVAEAEGLVTFPSYHTAVGIMVVYSLRHVRLAMAPVALLNATMIVGTIPEGGHHLTDVIAGAMVAVVSILAVRAVIAKERYEAGQTEAA